MKRQIRHMVCREIEEECQRNQRDREIAILRRSVIFTVSCRRDRATPERKVAA